MFENLPDQYVATVCCACRDTDGDPTHTALHPKGITA